MNLNDMWCNLIFESSYTYTWNDVCDQWLMQNETKQYNAHTISNCESYCNNYYCYCPGHDNILDYQYKIFISIWISSGIRL